jgi:hypothetical protein
MKQAVVEEGRGGLERSRLKTAGSTLTLLNQEALIFSCEQYPFPNQIPPPAALFKTVVRLPLTPPQLDRTVRLAHPHVIALRKIVRCSRRPSHHAPPQSYYSFSY